MSIEEKRAIIEQLERLREVGLEQLLAASSVFAESVLEQRVVENLRTQLQKLQLEESELTTRYTDENRELVSVRKQIDNIREMLDEEIGTKIIMAKSQLEVMRNKRTTLAGIIGRMEEESDSYPA